MKKISFCVMTAFGLSVCTFLTKAQTLQEGIQMFTYERFETAKQQLQPLATEALANYYIGLSELALENTGGAKAIFQKFPEDAANLSGVARVMIIESKVPEAMSMLTKIASKARKKDWLPYKYAADAITYTEGGDLNTAVEWYKKALEVERTGDVYIGLGDAYRKMLGGGGNAMTNYEYAEEFEKTKSIANYKMGNLWYAAKNYDSALVKYGKSSDMDEQNPLPYKSLADAYYRIKKYKIAKEKIEKYLERSDKTITDQIEYANTLYLAQDYPNAIQKMNDLVAKGEGNKRPYMYRILGYSQYETKDYTNALRNMDLFFAKIEPKKIIPSDYINYGKILLTDTNNSAKAAEYFERGIAIDTTKDKAPLFKQLAESYYDAQQYGLSAKYYQKLLDSNSPTIEALDYWWCGAMYYYNKDYQKADDTYKVMGEKYPTEPTSYFWRGNIAVATKDKDYKTGIASEYFTKYLGMINPADADKKKNVIKAYTYLAMVAYNGGKKEETRDYAAKLQAIDANDDTAKQLIKALDSMK